MLHKLFPFLVWFPRVNRHTLQADAMAGITGAVIVLPQGVAFAMIAGMPPEYGLYTAMITPVIAALFGSSWHLISGPTTAISIVVFSALNKYAEPTTADFVELAFIVTFLAGAFQLILGLAKMGTLVNFVSHTVVIGFTAGAAVLIATSQMKHFLGLDIPRGESFFHTWLAIGKQITHTNLYVVAVAMLTLISAILLKHFLPKWPYMLIAMVAGSLLSVFLQGESRGITLIGEIPSGLPPISVPNLTLENIRLLSSDALAIALLGLIEAVAIARAIATHTHQRIDGNQEFIGQGLSNLVGSFFSCYAGSGSFTRSGVNHTAGAKTPMAAIFAAVFLALILLLVAPLTAYLPIPAMGGIILYVAYRLIDFHHIKEIFHTSRNETAILLVTFLATLFLELEFAIYIGVILSLVIYLQRTSKPKIVRLAPTQESGQRKFVDTAFKSIEECPQVQIIRIDGSLFFGAINHVSNELHEISRRKQPYLLIVANGINFIDIAGAEFLVQEIHRWRSLGGDVYFSGTKESVLEFLQSGKYWKDIGEDHFFESKQEAIRHIFPLLDHQICNTCTARIFHECQSTYAESGIRSQTSAFSGNLSLTGQGIAGDD